MLRVPESDMTAVIDKVHSLGWNGVMFWGADRDGAKMNYFFKSPFLEKQEWASLKKMVCLRW